MCGRVKIASTEPVPQNNFYATVVSHPWWFNIRRSGQVNLVTTPIYPTPVEVICRVELTGDVDGWSDHCVGIHAATFMVARGAKIVEVHYSSPEAARQCLWDKNYDDVRRLREWMDECAVMRTGMSRKFAERWKR